MRLGFSIIAKGIFLIKALIFSLETPFLGFLQRTGLLSWFYFKVRWLTKFLGSQSSLILQVVCVCVCALSCFSPVCLFATLWTIARQAPLSMGFSRQDYWSGCHVLLQGVLLTQGLNLGHISCIGRRILYGFFPSATWEILTSCVNIGRSLHLLMSHFLICKMGTMIVF